MAAIATAVSVGVGVGIWLAISVGDTSGGRGTTAKPLPTRPKRAVALPSVLGGSPVTAAAANGSGVIALGTASGAVGVTSPGKRQVRGVVTRGRQILDLAIGHNAVAGIAEGELVWAWRGGSGRNGPGPYAVQAVALSRDGRYFAAGGFDVDVYDLDRSYRKIAVLQQPNSRGSRSGGTDEYDAIAFAPGSRELVAATFRDIDVYDIRSARRVGGWTCKCGADSVALSRDGRLAVFGTNDGHVLLWNVRKGRLLLDRTLSTLRGDIAYATAVSADGSRLAAGMESGTIVILDPRTRAVVERLRIRREDDVVRLDLTDRGEILLVEEKPIHSGGLHWWLVRTP
jgi:WD40 repeat protein